MTFLFVLGNAIPNFLEHYKIGRRKRGSVSDYSATTLVACFASVTYTVWAVNDGFSFLFFQKNYKKSKNPPNGTAGFFIDKMI